MLTADYQEIANLRCSRLRDNTVICGIGTREISKITRRCLIATRIVWHETGTCTR
jgi:hypothetical protein